jgi:acetyltransferase-like isoleucine patch superfamily enzyme
MLKNRFRIIITAFLCMFFPVRLIYRILNLLGHEIHSDAKIGFSLIWVNDKMSLQKCAKIGHLNFLFLKSITMYEFSYLEKRNKIWGMHLSVILYNHAALGNKISVHRAPYPVSYGDSVLQLGVYSKLTFNHKLDCLRSIYIGDYTTIAGSDTQLWTHGYYNANTGIERIRIDGEIHIGNNVYIGTRCTFNPGVKIADGIHIGGHCCISKSLEKQGMYVSQPLRFIENDIASIREKLDKIEGYDLCEEVYEKKI